MSGVTDGSFNGTFAITSTPSTTQITWSQTGSNGTSSGGTGALLFGYAHGYPSASTILTTTRTSNVVTVVLAGDLATLSSYPKVTIASVSDSSFNGTFTLTRIDNSHFTYPQTAANGSSTGGTASFTGATTYNYKVIACDGYGVMLGGVSGSFPCSIAPSRAEHHAIQLDRLNAGLRKHHDGQLWTLFRLRIWRLQRWRPGRRV